MDESRGRHDTIETIFLRALEIDAPAARTRYLDSECGPDVDLRREVDRLLTAHQLDDSIIDGAPTVVRSLLPQKDLLSKFGEFEIIREIGRGGMGIVYEADQPSLGRRVALKVLTFGLNLSKKSVERFQREAQAAARVHHTNIVSIHATGLENQMPYYVMELVDGPSLDRVIKQLAGPTPQTTAATAAELGSNRDSAETRNDLPTVIQTQSRSPHQLTESSGRKHFSEIARIIADAADALHHAHEKGIIHRDIKPSNLLLGANGRIYVNDFGLARIVEAPTVTMTGEVLGTPRYMSPEQVMANRVVDHRSDIYSLGVVLYELLTHRAAFDARERDRVLVDVLHRFPAPAHRLNPNVPLDLSRICEKAMQKLQKDRYQQSNELADDLRRFIHARPIHARPFSPIQRLQRWCSRNRSLAISCAIFSIVTLLGMTMIVTQSLREERRFQIELDKIRTNIESDVWTAVILIDAAIHKYRHREKELIELRNSFGRDILIESHPPNAKFKVRPVKAASGAAWLEVKTNRVRLPEDDYHVQAELTGYENLLVRKGIWKGLDRWTVTLSSIPDMVRVPPSPLESNPGAGRIAWLMGRKIPRLGEFHLDRHEVTNGEFEAFIFSNSNLYKDETVWKPLMGSDWPSTVKGFRDSTGEYGPADWAHGTYRPGLRDHPVVGVSWYEAKAYAAWKGKTLPSVFHWLRAADFNGWGAVYNNPPVYNIGNQLYTHRSVNEGLYSANDVGAIEMHGNVKEWCLNEERAEFYYALGGSYRDRDG